MRFRQVGMLVLLLLGSEAAEAEEAEETKDAWVGCWARAYDAAHLAKHQGQLVTAMTIAIDPRTPAGDADPGVYGVRVAANLRGKSETYTTLSAARCGAAGATG